MAETTTPGMNKTAAEWERVVPGAVVRGSLAQSSNVLAMAIEDIRRQDMEIAKLRTENARLKNAASAAHALIVTMKFEPDHGQPHPLKDGVYDKVCAKLRTALAAANPQDLPKEGAK